MNDIPVLIHHESDEKPSRGLGRKQRYLKYVVRQAESFNSRVVLIGDEYNIKWAKESYEASSLENDKWRRFERAFVNLSDYPDAWAKGIFKRFFLFEELCGQEGFDDLIVLDSDVLVYTDLSRVGIRGSCDAAFEWCESVDRVNDMNNPGSVVCGIGYFTTGTLKQFTDYCIDVYENKQGTEYGVLLSKWNKMKTAHLAGGVCEMTLLHMWLCETFDHEKNKVINLLERRGDVCFCNDLRGEKNYLEREFAIDRSINIKKTRFVAGFPYHYDIDRGEWIKVYDIHFGGDSKRFIYDMACNNQISAYNYIYYLLMRQWRTRLKPAMRRFRER